MIIHSDKLTYRDFFDAAAYAGIEGTVQIESIEGKGSRSRNRAFKFYLSGSSNFQPGFGRTFGDGKKAATWDEWGIVFAELFRKDPNAHCGKRGYRSADHFHWVTGQRFRHLHPLAQHKRHKWGLGVPDFTGEFSTSQCECGAIQRWFLGGTDSIEERIRRIS